MDAAANALVEVGKCLWGSLAEPISYVSNPTKYLQQLERELKQLMNESADTEKRVEAEEVAQLSQRTNQVAEWLKEVQDLKAEYDRVLEERNSRQQSRCPVWCCHSNCRSNYKLGKKIRQLCNDVRECQAAGGFNVLVNSLPPPTIREMPIEETVGPESMLSQVWNWLQDKHIGIIGLWGMGGVGKTTLLKRINEEFCCKSHGFHVVLWVVVSSQVNLDKIRESIRMDLGIGDDVWKHQSEEGKAAELCSVLNKKKFVLLMDDIWERLDVAKLGIPCPKLENGSKIVFTTRFEELCSEMEAEKRLRVQPLPPDQALELFQSKVGQDTLNLHSDIPRFAELIVQECKGLPLALIILGQAMSTKKNPCEWEHALNDLRSFPSKFSRIEDDVHKLLEFSYHSLKDSVQKCFLYCALFPQDYNINNDSLIDLWIGEGFLFHTNDTYGARLEGEAIIGSLKSACLLERGQYEDQVKMHDVIRDMALWIAHEHGNEQNRIIVEEKDVCISRWKEAERISLWGSRIWFYYVTEPLVCSRLVTLLIKNNERLETLPEEFFNSMHVLKVLDLSSNCWLTKLPVGVKCLAYLQYLNLSRTAIKALPHEMKNLTSLLYLLLDDTNYLVNIPKEVISSLFSLKVFRKSKGFYYIDEKGFVEGLEGLHQLNELSLEVHTAFGVQKSLESPNLQRSITSLTICYTSSLPTINIPTSSLRKILHLNNLQLHSCDLLQSIEIYEDVPRHVNDCLSRGSELANLHVIDISKCNKLRNLSWLIYAPNLQELKVSYCSSLEKIIDEDILQHMDENASAKFFSSLTSLILEEVPNLMSIHNRTLSSPLLRVISVWNCPRLKKLPFDSNSGRNSLEEIRAQFEWWSGLEWDDEVAKAFFTSKRVEW